MNEEEKGTLKGVLNFRLTEIKDRYSGPSSRSDLYVITTVVFYSIVGERADADPEEKADREGAVFASEEVLNYKKAPGALVASRLQRPV